MFHPLGIQLRRNQEDSSQIRVNVLVSFHLNKVVMWLVQICLVFIILGGVIGFKRAVPQKRANGATNIPDETRLVQGKEMKLEMSTVARKGKAKRPSKNGNTVSAAAAKALKNKGSTFSGGSSATTVYYQDLNKYPCLILNSDYRPLSHLPLSLWSWQDSLRALFSGRAVTVSTYEGVVVRSVADSFELPSIIALTSYHRNPMNTPTMSRKGIFLRDNYCCQYCDTKFAGDASKLSLDHLVPRSRGGELTWENTVTACMACNFQKGANGPEELGAIGMRLKRKPYVPTAAELQGKAKNMKKYKIQHEDWEDYL